jgi:hypothetical protein
MLAVKLSFKKTSSLLKYLLWLFAILLRFLMATSLLLLLWIDQGWED